MVKFLSELIIQALSAPGEWVLKQDLRAKVDASVIVVPARFITDLASIPRIFRGILNINGRSRRAAVLHDWLYCVQLRPRKNCDEIFYKALIAEGMPEWQARIYWAGVRAGGWVVWNARLERGGGLQEGDILR